MIRIAPALALAALLAGCGAPLPDGDDIMFAGSDPYDFAGMADAPAREIKGRLVLPPGNGIVRGAAILSHGSGGTGSRQYRMAEVLAEAGYASLIVDHFGPRDIGSTVEDQLRVTAQDMMADVFSARALLATHPRIPEDRVGVIGWSKGAITASLAAVDRLAGFAAPDGARMAFSIAFYPFCGWDLDDETLANPTLYLMGEEDNWTPPGPCVRQAEVWAAQGQPIEWEVYPDARHGFDSNAPNFEIGRAITVRDTSPGCTLRVDADGNTVTVEGDLGVDTLERRREFLDTCGVRGVTFGGQTEALEASRQRVLDFLEVTLPPA